MRVIAIDLMGNDLGVKPMVMAAFAFVKKFQDYRLILVGNMEQVEQVTTETHERIDFIDIREEIRTEKTARAGRDGGNSMATAINLVRNGEAEGVLSTGNSGALLSMATLNLKRIIGVKRPAFMPLMPTENEGKKFLLLDAGANLETTSDMLVQWALLGSIFAQVVLKVQNPRIGILNVGTEDEKGLEATKEAHQELKKNNEINYLGFFEARDLLKGNVDVAVVDGYAGNFILKTMEGTALSLLKMIKTSIKTKLRYKIGALLSKGAFKSVRQNLDYRHVGAA